MAFGMGGISYYIVILTIMSWQDIAVWVTAAAVAAAVVRTIVRRLRGKGNRGPCCGCGRNDCPDRIRNQ